MFSRALNLVNFSKHNVQTKNIPIWKNDLEYDLWSPTSQSRPIEELNSPNAAYLWETPTGGRMEAG